MRSILPFLIILFSTIVVFGCAEENRDAPAVSPPAKKVIASPSNQDGDVSPGDGMPESAPPKYRYDPYGRDPFESLLEIKKPVLPEESLTPLQKFDIPQLRLIGVIIGRGAPTAMVVAPDGKSYVLKKGVKVGKNDGTVVEITKDAILIQERFIDFSGDVRTVDQEIMLPKREGVE